MYLYILYFRHHRLCCIATRRELLEDANNQEIFESKYRNVCNVIVDEAQNFKDWDGDWYSLAEKLANQRSPQHLQFCRNYFWVFMDYSQKVHKFSAGLPAVIGKNNFMLSEVSRNTKEIFDFTTRFMSATEDVDPYIHSGSLQRVHSIPKLGHQYSSGKGVDILSCKEADIKTLLEKVMSGLLQNGVQENDIAILVGRRTQLDKLQAAVGDLKVTEEQKTRRTEDEQCLMEPSSSEVPLPQFSVTCETPMNETEKTSDRGLDDIDDVEFTSEYGSQEDADILSQSPRSEGDDFDVSEEMSDFADFPEGVCERLEAPPRVSSDDELNSMFDIGRSGVAIDTVRRFSGMDKAAIIGVNPEVNEDHADFNRFIVSLATRARDNLVIITSSETVKDKLEKFAHPTENTI